MTVVSEDRVARVIDAAYDTAVAPARWTPLLAQLADLFGSHFADAFARTQDRTLYRGVAVGLDREDYEDGLLRTWIARNVWSARRPVRDAGEIISTRQMVPKAELLRSEMYMEYLAPRGLHEGLRLSLWTSDEWIQDISLLRPWSSGPFGPLEFALARVLMPHLQRAAAIGRRLSQATMLSQAGLGALDVLPHAMLLLNDSGRPIWTNRAADALLAGGDGLALDRTGLLGATGETTAMLRQIVTVAGRASGTKPRSGRIMLPRPSGAAPLALIAMPLAADMSFEIGWTFLQPPTVLAMISLPRPAPRPLTPLTALFGLTTAEARVATQLLAGHSVAEIAAQSRRGVPTIRTHLARLMAKTGTRRQSELIRLLMGLRDPPNPDSGPIFS